MINFAFSGAGDTGGYGPTLNPHSLQHLAGGSSGGSPTALYYEDIDIINGLLQEGFGQEGAEPDVEAAVRAAIDTIGRLGAMITEVSAPVHRTAGCGGISASAVPRAFLCQGAESASGPAASYDAVLQQVNVLVMPTTPMKAHAYRPKLGMQELMTHGWNMLGNMPPFDMTGHPVISIPCAKSNGLAGPAHADRAPVDDATGAGRGACLRAADGLGNVLRPEA